MPGVSKIVLRAALAFCVYAIVTSPTQAVDIARTGGDIARTGGDITSAGVKDISSFFDALLSQK